MKQFLWMGLALSAILMFGACGDDTTTGPIDGDAPVVLSTSPVNSATSVAWNKSVTANFSEPMLASSLNGTTFLLKHGAATVSGTVSCTDSMATLNPAVDLEPNSLYTATISVGAKDLSGMPLEFAQSWSFTTLAEAVDEVAPFVLAISPLDLATDVEWNTSVTATFSEPMLVSTLNGTTFALKHGVTSVAGSVSHTDTTVTLTPSAALEPNTLYTASISLGATDLSGLPLAAVESWSFTTAAEASDQIAPFVLSLSPLDLATDVEWDTSVTATFSEPMLVSTLNGTTFALMHGETVVAGTVSHTDTTVTLTPTAALDPNTLYTASISVGATDLSGLPLAAVESWSFTTVAEVVDVTAPIVLSTNPLDLATDVIRNTAITANFSEPMLASTLDGTTFELMQGLGTVAGTVSCSGTTATLIPEVALEPNTLYTASISVGATDLAGLPLAAVKSWSFTTVATPVSGPQAVDLGTAGNYVILAKTAISTTGTTSVVGDLGLSPAAASYITGFALSAPPTVSTTSAMVTGNIWAADYDPPTPTVLTTAVLDMQNAFTDAAGRVLPDFVELGAGSIEGMTLVPGLYKWGTGVSFSSGVTLEGGADDIWIFQIAEDLIIGNGAIVTLSGGAQAKNVFWQVSGQAILGTTSDFKGIILCQTLISLNTGSTLTGRLLAQSAVTLDASAVTSP